MYIGFWFIHTDGNALIPQSSAFDLYNIIYGFVNLCTFGKGERERERDFVNQRNTRGRTAESVLCANNAFTVPGI